MQTQFLYSKEDKKKRGMYQYVHLYKVNYKIFKKRKKNEIFKNVVLTTKFSEWKRESKYQIPIKDGNFIVPEGVTIIQNNWYGDCRTITSVQLPSSLRSIGYSAFEDTNISTITIPEGVTSIGRFCFERCSSLTNIQLPSSLMSIGEYAFSNTKLKKVEAPKNFIIEKHVFDDEYKVIIKKY